MDSSAKARAEPGDRTATRKLPISGTAGGGWSRWAGKSGFAGSLSQDGFAFSSGPLES